jgi:hypothetical protein
MKKKCVSKDLIFYINNELSVEKRTNVEKHIQECNECRNFLSVLQDSLQIIEKEKIQEVSPFFFTRLSAKLNEELLQDIQRPRVRLVQTISFTILLLASIYGGLKLGSYASVVKVNQQTNNSLQMINDFDDEPVESFLLENL